MRTLILDNPMQGFLVKKALVDKIEECRNKGFKETDPEIHELKKALPKI